MKGNMEQTCTICGRTLDIASFHKKKSNRSGHRKQCKECVSEYYRSEYKENVKRRNTIVRAVKKRRKNLREFIIGLKDKPCTDCAQRFPHYVMDFDHVSGEKEKEIARAVHLGWSKERLLKEIGKCELVCANCHRVRTHSETQ